MSHSLTLSVTVDSTDDTHAEKIINDLHRTLDTKAYGVALDNGEKSKVTLVTTTGDDGWSKNARFTCDVQPVAYEEISYALDIANRGAFESDEIATAAISGEFFYPGHRFVYYSEPRETVVHVHGETMIPTSGYQDEATRIRVIDTLGEANVRKLARQLGITC